MIDLLFSPLSLTGPVLAAVIAFTVLVALALGNPAVPRAYVTAIFPLFALGYAVLIVTLENLRLIALIAGSPYWPLDPVLSLIIHAIVYVVVIVPVIWGIRKVWGRV